MFTNGLFFWKNEVNESEVQQPCSIRNVLVSKTNDKLIVFYQESEQTDTIKFFRKEGRNFQLYVNDEAQTILEHTNVCIDKLGKLLEVITEIKTKKTK